MRIETTRFGAIEISEDKVIYFPEGLVGFEDCKQYFALYRDEKSSVWWLQSVERPDVAFILTDPLNFVPDYEPSLSPEDLKVLQTQSVTDLDFNVILVVPKDPAQITANLLGPIIINPERRVGIQAVLRDNRYSAKYPLQQPAAAASEKGGQNNAYS